MKRLKVLIVGDALQSLNLKSDSSLFLARAYLNLGHRVFWSCPSDLMWKDFELNIQARELSAHARGSFPPVKVEKVHSLTEFAQVWMRKDPPFDAAYLRTCWLLGAHESEIRILNRPSALCRFHEKMLPYEGFRRGFFSKTDLIPMRVYLDEKAVEIPQFEGPWVVKPWLGYAGHRVEKFSSQSMLNVFKKRTEDLIFQPYDSSIETTGDRRVIFWKGKALGSFVRMPPAGGFVSNLAQGGTSKLVPLTAREKKILPKISQFLRSLKIDLAGIDLIGGKLNEINITSPTGFAALADLNGLDPSERIVKDLSV